MYLALYNLASTAPLPAHFKLKVCCCCYLLASYMMPSAYRFQRSRRIRTWVFGKRCDDVVRIYVFRGYLSIRGRRKRSAKGSTSCSSAGRKLCKLGEMYGADTCDRTLLKLTVLLVRGLLKYPKEVYGFSEIIAFLVSWESSDEIKAWYWRKITLYSARTTECMHYAKEHENHLFYERSMSSQCLFSCLR